MKTAENDGDVEAFLASVSNRGRAEDAAVVAEMMQRITGCPPRMWGDSIIGFDGYDYKRRDGLAHRWFVTGVSPRKANLTIYIMPGFKRYPEIMVRLGPLQELDKLPLPDPPRQDRYGSAGGTDCSLGRQHARCLSRR